MTLRGGVFGVSRLAGVSTVVGLLFSLGGGSAFAAAGGLDPGFGGGGAVVTPIGSGDDSAGAVVLQPDGKIVAAGWSFNGSDRDFALARYGPDGSLDGSFDGDGIAVSTPLGGGDDSSADAVAVQPDGKIVAAGHAGARDSHWDFALARYKPNGSLDASFDADGIVTTSIGGNDDSVSAVVLQPDGKIVAAGWSLTKGGSRDLFALARYNPDGSPDTSFSGDGKLTTRISGQDKAMAVVLQPDGKIVAAGYGSNDGNDDFELVRYNANGRLDPSFDGDGKLTTPIGSHNDQANAVALQPDGKIVAAGWSQQDAGDVFALARYNPDGSLDAGFDSDGIVTTPTGYAYAVAVQPDGKIVAAGHDALARYNPDGSLDTGFNGSGIVMTSVGDANAVALQPDGKLVSAGEGYNGQNLDFALARYCGGDPCDAVPATLTVKKSLRPSGDAGRFTLLVDATVVKVAARDGGTGTSLGAAGTHRIREIAVNGTNPNDYVSSIACTRNDADDVTGTGTGISVSVNFGDVEACTISNLRKATVTLRKTLSPSSDTGLFNLSAGSTTVAGAVGDGGSGSRLFAPGSLTLREQAVSGPGLSAYTSSIACTRNGSPGPSGSGTSLKVTVGPADLLDCTFTNLRNT